MNEPKSTQELGINLRDKGIRLNTEGDLFPLRPGRDESIS